MLSTHEGLWRTTLHFKPDPSLLSSVHNRRNLSEKTLAVTVRHFDGTLEYDAHNLYGLYQAAVTASALERLRGKRSFILSRRA